MTDLFTEIQRVIRIQDATEKCEATHLLAGSLDQYQPVHEGHVASITAPGYPARLKLVAPRELKRRSIHSQQGRNILLHAIAHIEFNAINLALDAAYRFRHQPSSFYDDWISIADDEARHFEMIRGYLLKHGCDYGDYPAHNGLWDMAEKTAGDVLARMALVPRVLEARGLDVTPAMMERLQRAGDTDAVAILAVIYQDEIGHVRTGSHWFFHHCEQRGLEPRAAFSELVDTHMHGELRGPFNISARLQAGFDEMEMSRLTAKY